MERLPASVLAGRSELGEYNEQLYYEYIVQSYELGQFTQVRELFERINHHGQSDCSVWLKENGYNEVLDLLLRYKIELQRQEEFKNG